MKFGKKKTQSEVAGTSIVSSDRMQRFNPLRNLNPTYLRQMHEEFAAGRIKSAARMWDAIERTDDVLQVVASKRKKAVSRHGYEIVQDDDSPAAQRHAEVLQFFYDQLIATRADDRNVRGGFPLFIRQMMDAVGKKYAVHEMVMKPVDGGLTAELVFCPLWYFENATGELRLLKNLGELNGSELIPGGWVIHSGDGVMEACATAYMFKHLPLQDWLLYSEKFGLPIPKGKSTGSPGSPEWNAMEDAVAALGACEGVVISQGSEIESLEMGNAANLPYQPLVERMDRALASIWRGADLSTISKGDGTGASLQGGETDLLEDDDADSITDTLNEQVDRFVILYTTGDTTPKAWVKIKSGLREDIQGDLAVDKTLSEIGWGQPAEDLEKRYGRTGLVAKPAAQAFSPLANEALATRHPTPDTEDALLKNARLTIAQAISNDLMPVADRLAQILDETPDEQLFQALEKFRDTELPELAKKALAGTAGAEALAETMTAALFNGIEQGAGSMAQGGKKA